MLMGGRCQLSRLGDTFILIEPLFSQWGDQYTQSGNPWVTKKPVIIHDGILYNCCITAMMNIIDPHNMSCRWQWTVPSGRPIHWHTQGEAAPPMANPQKITQKLMLQEEILERQKCKTDKKFNNFHLLGIVYFQPLFFLLFFSAQ